MRYVPFVPLSGKSRKRRESEDSIYFQSPGIICRVTARAFDFFLQIVRRVRNGIWLAFQIDGAHRLPNFLVADWLHFPAAGVVARRAVYVRMRRVVTGDRFFRLERVGMTFAVCATGFRRVWIVAIGAGFARMRAIAYFDFVRVAMTFLAQLGRRFHRLVGIIHRIIRGDGGIAPRDFFTHDFFLRLVALRAFDVFPFGLGNRLGRLDRKLARRARCRHFVRRGRHPIDRRVTTRARIIFIAFENVRVGVLAVLPQCIDVGRLPGGDRLCRR